MTATVDRITWFGTPAVVTLCLHLAVIALVLVRWTGPATIEARVIQPVAIKATLVDAQSLQSKPKSTSVPVSKPKPKPKPRAKPQPKPEPKQQSALPPQSQPAAVVDTQTKPRSKPTRHCDSLNRRLLDRVWLTSSRCWPRTSVLKRAWSHPPVTPRPLLFAGRLSAGGRGRRRHATVWLQFWR